jgi:transposase
MMEDQDARTLPIEAQATLRQCVVRAVLGGMTQTAAARQFALARPTINKWIGLYRRGGLKALAAKKKGRPKGYARLKGWQAAQTVRAITDKTPDQLKLPFMLWTREAVGALIAQRFGVRVSLMTVGRWLKQWGLTPQKPARRAWEQNPAQVERWLKQEYPRVKAEAKREKAEIHWGDEMGLRSDHQAGTTYGRRGQTPVIPGTGQRWRCNVISTITGRGTLRFMVFKRRFTAGVFIEFLGRLVRDSKQMIYLIVDGHPVHKSRAVERWLAARPEKIRMLLLPAYSPDLNPDEFLNHDVKQNAVGRRRAANQDDMIADVRGYLRSTQKQPEIVRRYFHAPSVQYAML